MTKHVQIVGCIDDEHDIHPFVADEHADYYGIYVGEPGAYLWVADFINKDDAKLFAELIAKRDGYVLDDQTFTETRLQ